MGVGEPTVLSQCGGPMAMVRVPVAASGPTVGGHGLCQAFSEGKNTDYSRNEAAMYCLTCFQALGKERSGR